MYVLYLLKMRVGHVSHISKFENANLSTAITAKQSHQSQTLMMKTN